MLFSRLRSAFLVQRAAMTRKRPFSSTPKKPESLWDRYTRLLEEHPTPTKVVSSGVIMGSGDLACQCITQESWSEFEPHRTSKFFILGAAFVAPALHLWYGWLIRVFPAPTTVGALKRLALDQLVFAPTFIPVFFAGLQFLDGDTDTSKIVRKLEADYWDTLVANWVLWVPAQLINFRFVKNKYQVLYSNMVGFVWNIFMSFQSFKK